MFCTNCGAEVKSGAEFCLACGARQQIPVEITEIEVEASAPAAFADGSLESMSDNPVIIEDAYADVGDTMGIDPTPAELAHYSDPTNVVPDADEPPAPEMDSLPVMPSPEMVETPDGALGETHIPDAPVEELASIAGDKDAYSGQATPPLSAATPMASGGMPSSEGFAQEEYRSPWDSSASSDQKGLGENAATPFAPTAPFAPTSPLPRTTPIAPDMQQQNPYGQQQYQPQPYGQPYQQPYVTQQPVQQQPYSPYPAYGQQQLAQQGQYPVYPQYQQPQYGYPPQEKKKMSGGKIAAIIIAIVLGVALIVGGIFFVGRWFANSIDDLSGYSGSSLPSPLPTPPNSSSDIGSAANNGYPSYETLIDDYFVMLEAGDESAFADFLHPKVIKALDAEGIPASEITDYLDGWVDYYGTEIKYYSIYDVYPYENSDYAFLSDYIGFDQAEIEQYVDVEVDVEIVESGSVEDYIIDFDLIKVSGRWYIIEVW